MYVHMGIIKAWCFGFAYNSIINETIYNNKRLLLAKYYHNRIFLFNNNIVLSSFILSIIMASSSSSSSTLAVASDTEAMDPTTAVLIRVDPSGQGDYKKIQDAIDSVPSNNAQFVFILVKPGTYREKIVVPADKPYITLSGTKASDTIITWNDGHEIFDSATVTILASHFVGRYLTIKNTYGSNGKGVALRVTGDKAAFYASRFSSYQDTLLDDAGRHYYSNCYIEGATDFICGNAASIFEKCHVHSIVPSGNGAITAQKRDTPWESSGFIFMGCKITGTAAGTVHLGRPWGIYSRVVYIMSYMSDAISPDGWNNWGDAQKQSTVLYGEYKCYGPGANRTKRAGWSKSLSPEEAAPYLTKDMIGGIGWLRPAPTNFKRGF